MTINVTWRTALIAAALVAAGIACDRNCAEPAPLQSGDYMVGERLYGGEELSDDWTKTNLPGAQLNLDREAKVATLVYERDGTTYQVLYTLDQ